MDEKLMPDFDTRRPQEQNVANEPRLSLVAHKLRSALMTSRLRALLIGGGILLFVVAVPVGLLIHSVGGPADQRPVSARGGENSRVVECAGGGENGRLVFLGSVMRHGSPTITYSREGVYAPVGADLKMYMINADGTDLTQLTKATAREYGVNNRSTGCRKTTIRWRNSTQIANISYGIGYSPDGTKKVFAREKHATARAPGNVDLYVADADGSNETRITKTPSIPESSPTWLPDGKTIAYASWQNEDVHSGDIFVMNADGSNQKNLTDTPADDDWGGPVSSPDGTKIAFLSTRDYSVNNVYVMSSDGTGLTHLTGTGVNVTDTPMFSPDSTKLAFVGEYGKVGEPTQYDIYVKNVDGPGLTRLTHNSAWEGIVTWLRAKNE